MLRVKYLNGSQIDSIRIKKLPVYIGSKRDVNVLPFHIENMEPLHGFLFIKNNKLFYQDKSKTGSIVNNNFIKSKKIQLKPGDNELLINNNRFIIENNTFYSDYSINTTFYSKIKSASSLISVAVLIMAALLLYLFVFKPGNPEIVSFNLSSDTLYVSVPFQLKDLVLKDGSGYTDSTLTYTLIFDNKDSISIKNKSTFIYLPHDLIGANELERKIEITLGIKAANQKSQIKVTKSFLLSNRQRTIFKDGIQLKLKVIRNLLDYEFTSSRKKITKIDVNYGDGSKIANTTAAPKTYSSDGAYTFTARVFHDGNNTPIIFSVPVIIKSE